MKIIFLILIAALSVAIWAAELDLIQLCLNKTMNEVLIHPLDCRGYIECSEEPSVYYCEAGFYFDIERMICNLPENVNCQLLSQPVDDIEDVVKPFLTSLMALDTMTGEVIDPMTGYEPLNVACRHFGAYFLPHPKHCRSYYLCAYGHMHEHSCGPNTLWNYTTQQCVASHQAICYQLSDAEEMEINDSNSVVCYPANTTNSTTTEIISSNDTDYTTPTMSTTMPIPVPPTIPPPNTNISKKPNSSNPFNIRCPPRRKSYLAHPKDCRKYYICITGRPILTSCPEGRLWDSNREYCELVKNVKCFQEKNKSVIKPTKE